MPGKGPAFQALGAAWACAWALPAIQLGFDIAHHIHQTRANIVFKALTVEMKRRRAAIECEDAGPVGGNERDADRAHIGLPFADRECESAAGKVLLRAF